MRILTHNNHFFSLCIIFSTVISSGFAENPFKCNDFGDKISFSVKVNSDTTIRINTYDVISQLAIDAEFVLLTDDSFLRVLLTDIKGNSHVVLEANKMYFEDSINYVYQYAEETICLNEITPASLDVYCSSAYIFIDNVYICNPNLYRYSSTEAKNLFKKQRQIRVNSINQYNKFYGKLWIADVNEISLLSFEERKRVLGISNKDDSYGLEYYNSGIFEFNYIHPISNERSQTSYVSSFDWRNRHGKNWITSVKDQGYSGYCWAFACTALTEAMANLYYNRLLELDLSEQDVGWYTYANNPNVNGYYGGSNYDGLAYIRDNGIIDEEALPFIDSPNPNMPNNRPTGSECVSFNSFSGISMSNYIISLNPDTLKFYIIHKGPLLSGYSAYYSHSMLLVGYDTIEEGDTIYLLNHNQSNNIIIGPDNQYIGSTYWIFKNSYGSDYGYNGYTYVLFSDYQYNMLIPKYLNTPITTIEYDESDVVWEDTDGDGYYWWGIGDKPISCPSWIPSTPDGDDTDYTYGPMDMYGNLENLTLRLNDTLFIDDDTLWDDRLFVYRHIVLRNAATLTINNNVTFYQNVDMIIQDGSSLILNNGILFNANIKYVNPSQIRINGGEVKYRDSFYVPIGSVLNVNKGIINSF